MRMIWAVVYRSEIERKQYFGYGGVEATLTWTRSILQSINPSLPLLDFQSSFSYAQIFYAILSYHSSDDNLSWIVMFVFFAFAVAFAEF